MVIFQEVKNDKGDDGHDCSNTGQEPYKVEQIPAEQRSALLHNVDHMRFNFFVQIQRFSRFKREENLKYFFRLSQGFLRNCWLTKLIGGQ